MDPIVKQLHPGEKEWTFLDGSSRSACELRSCFIGYGRFLPGWRWSEHVGNQEGAVSSAHIGYVLSGRFGLRTAMGTEAEVGPGEAFELLPGHDAWVIGDVPCIALDFGNLGD